VSATGGLDGRAGATGAALLDLVAIMDRLRTECPWDARQTHESLVPYLLEETYETLEAIERGDIAELRGELGENQRKLVDAHFAMNVVADAHRDLYQRAISDRR